MQGKKPKQIRDSNAFAGIAVFGIITLLVVVLFSTLPETPTPTEGIPQIIGCLRKKIFKSWIHCIT